VSIIASITKNFDVVLDLDSTAAVLVCDGRYLLQHREDRPGISYPGWWSLFGGAREASESAEQAIFREIREELELELPNCRHLITCWYEIAFENRVTRKAFFAVELEANQTGGLVLHEGQGMAWFTASEIRAIGDRIVPYDLGILALYDRLRAS
jgi:8-oxo-dGTP diphosphatase